MKKIPPWKTHNERGKVLNLARDLAPSGRHADHRSIIAQLQTSEGLADASDRLQGIRSQLDMLCALAQPKPPSVIPGRKRPENDGRAEQQ